MNKLSKSRFLVGSQCHRQLWWSVHEPQASELEIEPGTAMIFAQGHLVGEEARGRFPGGVLVDLPHDDIDARIARTQELMAAGVPAIFEASFRHEGVFVAVDVLARGQLGWDLIEVKCTTRVKQEHLLDVALQRHVLRGAGVNVERALLMHLSRECVFPDVSNLFETADLTEAAIGLEAHVATEARAQRRMLDGTDVPFVDTGAHCTQPRECPFFARCHASLPQHHVTTLYAIGRRAEALVERGFDTIASVDGTVRLSVVARRQVRAVKANRTIIEPALVDALATLDGPLAFFDLETVAFAIPRHHGCRPWDAVPAQASIHIEGARGLEHHAFLAEADGDPRPALARFVIDALRGARIILTWNASFERRCLQQLALAFPDLAAELDDVIARLVDLLPIVRNHVYHPDFGGSFSLKSVAPALVPALTYEDLAIAGGTDASAMLFRMFTEGALDEADRAALLAYCGQDTLALVGILDALRVLARAA